MNKIGICGGGLIGASWALGFSSNKYKVFVYDSSTKVREEFLNTVKSLYEDLSILKDISFNEIKSNIVICEAIEDICKDTTLIQESIIENLEEIQYIYYLLKLVIKLSRKIDALSHIQLYHLMLFLLLKFVLVNKLQISQSKKQKKYIKVQNIFRLY